MRREMAETESLQHAREQKEQGDRQYKAGEARSACEYYLEALRFLDSESGHSAEQLRALAHSNLSQAALRLSEWELASEHSRHAIALQPTNTKHIVKALLRHASAQLRLERSEGALFAVKSACQLEPRNPEALALQREIQQAVSSHREAARSPLRTERQLLAHAIWVFFRAYNAIHVMPPMHTTWHFLNTDDKLIGRAGPSRLLRDWQVWWHGLRAAVRFVSGLLAHTVIIRSYGKTRSASRCRAVSCPPESDHRTACTGAGAVLRDDCSGNGAWPCLWCCAALARYGGSRHYLAPRAMSPPRAPLM